jgi:hypothetical protein
LKKYTSLILFVLLALLLAFGCTGSNNEKTALQPQETPVTVNNTSATIEHPSSINGTTTTSISSEPIPSPTSTSTPTPTLAYHPTPTTKTISTNTTSVGSNVDLVKDTTETSEKINTGDKLCYASSKSDVYHAEGCRYVSRIKSENLIVFSNREEAENAGYKSCSVCGG